SRPFDYATGDDSVVRAQAREVRRRLDKYYAAHTHGQPLRIELPIGSYTPEFKLDAPQSEEVTALARLSVPPSAHPASIGVIEGGLIPGKKRFRRLAVGVLAALTCISI